jgi:protein SCO1
MNSRKVQWTVWGVLALTIAAITIAYLRERMSLSVARSLPPLFEIQPFTLTNQQGQAFSSESLRGRVWVTDIIFTRCAGPCPKMTGMLAELQKELPQDQPVSFITVTTDPKFDTPEVLARYAKHFNADPARWQFLTGTPEQARNVAVNTLKLTALEKEEGKRESAEDLFIHSTIFVVVDKRGQARAVIESDQPGAGERTLEVIRALVKEPR